MNLLILLLAVIILLLLVIITMLATGWPGKQREEVERLGNSLRREILEQRSGNLQLMKSLRIVIEDAVRESVEKEMMAVAPRGRSRRNSRKKIQEAVDLGSELFIAGDEDADNGSYESPLQAMQLSLFSEMTERVQAAAVPDASPDKTKEREPEGETIHMGYVDDIPDVE
ncbi:MAG TPA: hypothetical protein DEB17_01540 [Chlorobaculum sp.]|uniref:Uncharacterized protein n=1 Tax=Chlorobaculum tepidum (strain ATCC 49652 / DSM 12025 / NBRC 103806 / TLS) TaxID=194439 RepID=Q8KCJ2_CHLTE|nr:hypothetical protein [Chlorobaculum tepidum]AAM72657.1 hypothetical protein CT1429 [Chlorobaculum tepidum TLS]HBU22681.1 hypothetical protein [Chlorobaculum sp.]